MLPYIEGGNSFNALNFNLAEYNDANGANYTGATQVVAVYLCPSSTRQPDGGRDGAEPASLDGGIGGLLGGAGYGYNDYGPTVYKTTRANGCLKQGMTRIAEITDGTSNTVAIAEDAGRDPRYLSPYIEGYWNSTITRQVAMATINPNDPGPAGGYTPYRRYWRWAEPDSGYGVSGAPIVPTTKASAGRPPMA